MRIVIGILSMAFALFIGLSQIEDGFSWKTLVSSLFFALGALVLFFEKRIDKRTERIAESMKCKVGTTGFIFQQGYYFRYGYMKGKKELPFSAINEVRATGFPPSVLVNNNEIIFLKGLEREQVLQVAAEKNIPVTHPQDNWSLILDEFLDTELDEDDKNIAIVRLENAGIAEEELNTIKRKLRLPMLMLTYFSMEWVYYGQYDAMTQMILTEKKYWWTMDIALRGNQKP